MTGAGTVGGVSEALEAAVDGLDGGRRREPAPRRRTAARRGLRLGPGDARRRSRARHPGAGGAQLRRDGATAAAARAGRVHPRPPGLPLDRALGRPAGPGAAARDRAAGRAGARAAPRRGARRRHRLGRGGAGDRRRAPRLPGDCDRHLAGGPRGRARATPRPSGSPTGSASRRARCRGPASST